MMLFHDNAKKLDLVPLLIIMLASSHYGFLIKIAIFVGLPKYSFIITRSYVDVWCSCYGSKQSPHIVITAVVDKRIPSLAMPWLSTTCAAYR